MPTTTPQSTNGHSTQAPRIDAASPAVQYAAIRSASMRLREPLTPEDCQAQSMPGASPVKWHLAHTTWFYEQFILARFRPGRRPHHPQFNFLFNSYYNALGPRHERPRRGILSRPSLHEVETYRHAIDAEMLDLLDSEGDNSDLRSLLEVGLNHEQQHQELILTDLKHLLSLNPLHPAYIPAPETLRAQSATPPALTWRRFDETLAEIGHDPSSGVFAYDNEQPRHRVFLHAFELASRPITCAEYLGFIEAGGYTDPRFWLDEGWTAAQREHWQAPLYWEERDGQWHIFTLSGLRAITPDEPVCHLSYFEADAFARWAGARLPTEHEWEHACAPHFRSALATGNFADSGLFHPRPLSHDTSDIDAPIRRAFGDVWEWTASPYTAYPGYTPPDGALGEYNGKFMCNQWVLRGGSCATPASHIRPTYRNFFQADSRWQFTGLRLARDAR